MSFCNGRTRKEEQPEGPGAEVGQRCFESSGMPINLPNELSQDRLPSQNKSYSAVMRIDVIEVLYATLVHFVSYEIVAHSSPPIGSLRIWPFQKRQALTSANCLAAIFF